MKPKVCLMLAAGLSSRMGQWKMMLPWGEGTVLDGALAAALSFCDRVVLVTGFRGAELNWRYGDNSRITLRHNECFTEGMFSSIRCGVEAVGGGHFFLALGDMPAVSGAVYRTLWQQRDARCLIPEYAQGKGHPVLLPPAMRGRVLAADNDTSMKVLIARHGQRRVPVADGAIHWDMDTPEQYQRLLRRR
ncbi:molybdenum cofactor cytidylyltransferase [Gibbsiella quercinecans]|uniref:CTP--molybdopterin cytidylyltransferase n=2 Tax=Gibbsiella TaxID=929812 RepID=A0A250AX01_9GAMM|nr:NTP transferase domain-containing protein [Gibbsiella quercinecans]ATA18232.1 CTP--molybdopterin cytidylyltransferase [Gibbsiella quercinecans]RLM06801.1 CTP--molybdopterin cytidylyltransferase [Gibbsiella quercinecans]RLM12958.1 CTP--molybdopterin cytidylyltransferase [Gibbsiella quercinecans]TCT92577.1 molybdenum cofactor cytidylyltransferase [Gibbsiella quercinecans]